MEYRLGEIITLINGYAFKSKEFVSDGIPVLKIRNVKAGALNFANLSYVNEDYVRLKSDKVPNFGDLLITMTGNRMDGSRETWVGKVALFEEKSTFLINQRVAILRVTDSEYIDNKYLSYLLSSPGFQEYFISIATSSGGQANISPKQVKDIFVSIPDISTQKSIVNIINPFDTKIKINNQIIATFEEIASTLFQHWFVDFEFPDENGNPYKSNSGKMVQSELGEIPESWGVTTLEKYVEVKYGKDHKKLADGKYPVYGSGGVMRYVDDYLYDNESVLVPRKGTLNNVMYVHEPFWSVDTMFYTIMKKKNSAKFIYLFLDRVDLKSMNVGSAVPSMTTKILNNMKIIQPSENMLTNFEVTVGPMFEKIKQLHTENDKLTELRDTLLPKLLSGEIELPVEEEVRV